MARLHRRQTGADHVQLAFEVVVHDAVKVPVRHVLEKAEVKDARVVDQDVDAAKAPDNLVHRPLGLVFRERSALSANEPLLKPEISASAAAASASLAR
jgi:hypothetical protein